MTEALAAEERQSPPGGLPTSPRRDIQGLRALAVLAVLMDHLAGWPRGGFVGVDIFFVISGFLITGLLLREYERTGSISFRSFYVRRFKRIMPVSVLVLFVTVVMASLLFPTTRTATTMGDALWSLVFAGNWRFAISGSDYFQEGALPSPLQHYWSLGVEEQFYLVWPWLLLVVLAIVARARGTLAVRRGVLAVTVLALIVASFSWAQAETALNPTVAYFSTASRAWELGVGALLAVLAPVFARLPERLRSPLAWLGLTGMVVSIFWLAPGHVGFPAPLALFPVVSVAVVIAAGIGARSTGPWPLTNPVSRYVGDISFSLYLWHWPVMVLVTALTPGDGIRYYLWSLILVPVLSVCSYHLVEDPLRREAWFTREGEHGRLGRRPGALRTVAAVAVVCVAGAGVVLAAFAVRWDHAATAEGGPSGQESVLAGSAEAIDAAPAPTVKGGCLGAAAMAAGEDCAGLLGDRLLPSLETFAEDTGGQYQCWRSKDGPAFPDCDLGDPGGTLRVALIGDSHAASFLPAVEAVAERHGWELDVFTGFACHWYAHEAGDNCYGPLQDAEEALLTGEPYDAVLVTSSRYDDSRPLQERTDLYVRAWEPVAARGTRIIAVTDVPAATEESIQCLTRIGFSVTDNDCGVPREEALARVDPLPRAASRVEGAAVVDLTEYFCTEDLCPAVIGNTVVYRDASGHISSTYARSLTPFLEEDLLGLLDQ
ncbi:acyltransferase family protein [Citricoccus sp.]|mgnify:CR=1 FL=1|uniref:acyltransferase family protein n=1 Tax=Citricoccus sp. TaxID=1978372 RepID=UPI002619F724|nr:acyltransferase family protein [Citricoccus sp.]HRO30968.1 acyltransferase family protein [Citricoccus sp.]HRO93613.1 acyltransferase family protein [Citricoccus sp.]